MWSITSLLLSLVIVHVNFAPLAYQFATRTVSITNKCPSEHKVPAISVSFNPTVPHISCSFSLYLPGLIKNNYFPTKTEELKSHKSVPDLSTLTKEKLAKLSDISLWSDRTVVILAVNRLVFYSHESACPALHICAIPLNSNKCSKYLGEISGTCYDNIEDPRYFLLPWTSSLSVTMEGMELSNNASGGNLELILSIGYRLNPGEFECPSGYFACDNNNSNIELREPRENPLIWSKRICLPIQLWCDRIINCPFIQNIEENKNCTKNDQYPMNFVKNQSIYLDELKMYQTILDDLDKDEIYHNASILSDPNLWSRTIWILFLLLILLIIIILIIGLLIFLFKCRFCSHITCRKRHKCHKYIHRTNSFMNDNDQDNNNSSNNVLIHNNNTPNTNTTTTHSLITYSNHNRTHKTSLIKSV